MASFADHLWQSLLVCGFIASCAFMTRASRAVFRLWLWRAALLKFAVPLSLFHALGGWIGYPVAHTADPVPSSLLALSGAMTPAVAPFGQLQVQGSVGWWLPLAFLASLICVSGVVSRIGTEQRNVRMERERQARDVNDIPRYPGLWATAFMASTALAIVSAPLIAGALADRKHRHELLIANSLSLRRGQIVMAQAAPGMGERYRVVADPDGVLIRNANLIDIVAIVYAIHRSAVWTEYRPSADPEARRNFWMVSPRYDVRVTAPVLEPAQFDPYALRQPLTKLLAERFGLEINLDSRCQPPCGNYGVAMSADPL
jgi:hypothetical protein